MKDRRAGKSGGKAWGPPGRRPAPGMRSGQRPRKPGGGAPTGGTQGVDDGLVRLFGSHAVEAALANPQRRLRRLLATENAERRLADAIAARGVLIDRATPGDLDHLLGADTVHQGLLLEAEPLPEPTLADLVERARTLGPLVLLDHVTDPHNVGAVLRSAAAFGAGGLIFTRRHSAPLNGVLAKAASGALDAVPLIRVVNLARAIGALQQEGFVCAGLDSEATEPIDRLDLGGRIAFVFGAEGRGLRRLTRDRCDRLARIPQGQAVESLNVASAAAIALYERVRQRSG